jgi:anti-sigma-K factor RskA
VNLKEYLKLKTEEYIASGILENYILGVVSPQEKQEVECMSHIYPEIKQELIALELAMENYLLSQKTPVPQSVWEKIALQLEDKPVETKKQAEIISINRPGSIAKWIAVVSIAAVFIFGFFLVQTKNQLNESEIKFSELDNNASQLKNKQKQMESKLEHEKSLVAFFSNPDTKSIKMNGIPEKDATANSQICWNTTTKKVMLCIGKLPVNSSDKQYQLWAIVDGKPVDLGVFDSDGTRPMIKMKSIDAPQAFAVTLEKKGGSVVPTLTEMYVLGTVS